jgi:hypothetical protein
MLTPALRSRWFALLVHTGLWGLLVLTLAALGGRAPRFSEATTHAPPPPELIPTKRIQTLFSAAVPGSSLADTNLANPFFTRHFQPPVVPPPTTRKVELTYHGFFIAVNGPKTALVKVDETLTPVAAGGKAVANLFVADVSWQLLILTNAAGQTNLLPLNTKKAVEVPIP